MPNQTKQIARVPQGGTVFGPIEPDIGLLDNSVGYLDYVGQHEELIFGNVLVVKSLFILNYLFGA